MASEKEQYGMKRFLCDALLFVYIALPILGWAWALDFFTLDTPYEVSADIRSDRDGVLKAKVYYVLKGINHQFDEQRSVQQDLSLQKDQFAHFSVRLSRTNKTLKRLRLDLGDQAGIRVAVKNLRVGGHSAADIAKSSEFDYHDLKLVSSSEADGAVFETTGADPYIASRHTVISPARVWIAVFIALLISGALFAVVRFIPSVRHACGLDWENTDDQEKKPAADEAAAGAGESSEVKEESEKKDVSGQEKAAAAAEEKSEQGSVAEKPAADEAAEAAGAAGAEQQDAGEKAVHPYGAKGLFFDGLLFLYIALPIFFLAWALDFFTLSTPYEVSADIRSDRAGVMRTQVFYIMKGLNKEYGENYSVRQDLNLQKDQFAHLSVKLNRTNKTVRRLRLDLGDQAGGRVTVKDFKIGGHPAPDLGKSSEYVYNDLRLVSSSKADGTVFDVTGPDPFIASKHTVISSARVWVAVFIALLISGALFSIVRFIPSVRHACGLDWENEPEPDAGRSPAASSGAAASEKAQANGKEETAEHAEVAPEAGEKKESAAESGAGEKQESAASEESFGEASVSEEKSEPVSRAKGLFFDGLLFLYIALPIFFLAWALDFFTLSTPYEVSADIRSDRAGVMKAQVFYIMKGLNRDYGENYSVRQDLNLQKDQFAHLSVRLNRTNKTVRRLRLDLGDQAGGRVTVKDLKIGGHGTADLGKGSEYVYNDLRLVSSSKADGTVFDVTGSDPYIASKHTVISSARVWVAAFIALLISGALFSIVRFIPSVRHACGLDWENEPEPGAGSSPAEAQQAASGEEKAGEKSESGKKAEPLAKESESGEKAEGHSDSQESTAGGPQDEGPEIVTRRKALFLDALLFVYIALPIFFLAWALDFFTLNTPYEVSADIKADRGGVMKTQVFYIMKGLNTQYSGNYSVGQDLNLQKDQFAHLSVRLNRTNKTLKRLRLDLGDQAGVRVSVLNFKVGGRSVADPGNSSQFAYHDLKLVSASGPDGAVFETTGTDPYFESRHTVISQARVWAAVFIVLLISGALFVIVRFIPSVRNACGLDWEVREDGAGAEPLSHGEGASEESAASAPAESADKSAGKGAGAPEAAEGSEPKAEEKPGALSRIKGVFLDTVLFVYIALPIFFLSWALGFFTLSTPYEVSADIRADSSGVMKAQVFYIMRGLNSQYGEEYSVTSDLGLTKDQFSHLSVRVNHAKKTMKRMRLDLGDQAGIRVTVRNLMVGGHSLGDAGDSGKFSYHDLKLLSSSKADGASFEVTGPDPYIESRHTVISSARVWVAVFITLLIAGAVFSVIRFIPPIRRACGLDWENEAAAAGEGASAGADSAEGSDGGDSAEDGGKADAKEDGASEEKPETVTRKQGMFLDSLLFVYIALPVFFLAWALGFFSMNTPYEVSADIRADYSGVMKVQVYYVMKGLNHQFAEQYSVRQDLSLQKDQFSHLSVRLNRSNKTMRRLRLDLGDQAGGRIALMNLRVGGRSIADPGDSSAYEYHDLKLVSSSKADGALFEVIGSDPFIASKHTVISSVRVWIAALIALIISGAVFAVVRFIPSVRRACGLAWEIREDSEGRA